jgi:hypothetical protein
MKSYIFSIHTIYSVLMWYAKKIAKTIRNLGEPANNDFVEHLAAMGPVTDYLKKRRC